MNLGMGRKFLLVDLLQYIILSEIFIKYVMQYT